MITKRHATEQFEITWNREEERKNVLIVGTGQRKSWLSMYSVDDSHKFVFRYYWK